MEELLKGISDFVSMPAGRLFIAIAVLYILLNAYLLWYAIKTGNQRGKEAAGLTEKAMLLLEKASERQAGTEQAQRVIEQRQTEALNIHTTELQAIRISTEAQQQVVALIRGTMDNQTSILAKLAVGQDDLRKEHSTLIGAAQETLTIVKPLPGAASDTYMQVKDLTSDVRALRSELDVALKTLTGAVETLIKRTPKPDASAALAKAVDDVRDQLRDIEHSITELLARTASSEAP